MKKNWNEDDTSIFIWTTIKYCQLSQKDFKKLVRFKNFFTF